jgi:excisionase family DNA binding protein
VQRVNAPRLLGIEDAAAYVGRNVYFMRRLVADRGVIHYRVGHLLRFDRRDLDAFLTASRVEARP